MSKCNTKRNHHIASLYGRMPYSKIAKIIGCSRSCVAGVIRWHVKKMPRLPEDDTRQPQAPSVAYIRGLEGMRNSRYRMTHHD